MINIGRERMPPMPDTLRHFLYDDDDIDYNEPCRQPTDGKYRVNSRDNNNDGVEDCRGDRSSGTDRFTTTNSNQEHRHITTATGNTKTSITPTVYSNNTPPGGQDVNIRQSSSPGDILTRRLRDRIRAKYNRLNRSRGGCSHDGPDAQVSPATNCSRGSSDYEPMMFPGAAITTPEPVVPEALLLPRTVTSPASTSRQKTALQAMDELRNLVVSTVIISINQRMY